MTILITDEFGTRELEGEELESHLAAKDSAEKAILDAEALLQIAEQMRNYRNEILMRCDWTELPSSSLRLDAEALAAWTTYRQALRDIPSQTEFPLKITWPTQP